VAGAEEAEEDRNRQLEEAGDTARVLPLAGIDSQEAEAVLQRHMADTVLVEEAGPHKVGEDMHPAGRWPEEGEGHRNNSQLSPGVVVAVVDRLEDIEAGHKREAVDHIDAVAVLEEPRDTVHIVEGEEEGEGEGVRSSQRTGEAVEGDTQAEGTQVVDHQRKGRDVADRTSERTVLVLVVTGNGSQWALSSRETGCFFPTTHCVLGAVTAISQGRCETC
jgi:hypothetical protein